MPMLLRRVVKRHWDTLPWLKNKDSFQSDIFLDFLYEPEQKNYASNTLSLWWVEEKTDDAHLNRVLAALTAYRDHIDKFDYALINKSIIDELKINLCPTKGVSADDVISELYHVDAIELTGYKLYSLVKAYSKVKPLRKTRSEVRNLIDEHVNNLNLDKVSESIKKKLPTLSNN